MKIDCSNNIIYKGKNPKLVTADKVLRLMNAHYPTASNTRFSKFNVVKNNTKNLQEVALYGISFALLRRKLINSEINDTPFDYFKGFLKSIKNHNISNCFEMVKLFNFILDLNNIKAHNASICPSEINHCVSLIPLKEDSFEKIDFTKTPISKMKDFLIADPWLGIVDYAPNIAVLYKHHPDYNRCVGSPENFDNLDDFIPKFKLEDYYLYPQDYHLKEMTIEDKKFFADNHPELIIDKKELIKH